MIMNQGMKDTSGFGITVVAPNSYSRDPWVRTFINIKTAVMASYLDGFYMSSQCQVSILRYEKGDGRQMDYALVKEANLLARSLGCGLELAAAAA